LYLILLYLSKVIVIGGGQGIFFCSSFLESILFFAFNNISLAIGGAEGAFELFIGFNWC